MPTRAPSNTKPSKPNREHAMSRAALALLFALCAAASVFAQGAQREVPATVAGRVTDGERGVPGVVVMLTPGDQPGRAKVAARAKTDAEGRYRLTNVPPGRYQAVPFAPAYVVEGLNDFPPGKPLTLAAGDVAEDVDFRMERGGVVTGRVTDAEGNPVIGIQVSVAPVDNNQRQRPYSFDPRDRITDDRGVYRIYGLAAGRYRVSAGQGGEGLGAITFGSRKLYRRTFYPDATEEAQAEVIEIRAGGEATDIDIKLGSAVKTYKASGVFVESETGRPSANVVFGYGALDPTGQRVSSFGGGMATDALGEFQTEGLAPGRYAVFAYPFGSPQNNNEFYSDPVKFEVADADVTGLVVRLKRGSSLSGVVTVEGVSDRATAARLVAQVNVFAYYETNGPQMIPGYVSPTKVAPDGSFRIAGLRPGKLRIGAGSDAAKGITLSRVEMNGANVTNGFDVTEGTQLTGVRIVVVYGSAVIRGQVNYAEGVTPPPGARVMASARRVGAGGENARGRGVEVDSRGRFRIEGLAAGDYEVQVRSFGRAGQMFQSESQRVSLAEGGDTSVTLTLAPFSPRGGVKP